MSESTRIEASSRPGSERSRSAPLKVVAAVLGFSTITIFTQLAMQAGATLPSILFLRYVVALGPLVAVAGWASVRSVPRRQAVELTVIGGGFQAAVAWLSLSALAYVSAATLVFLFYTFPVWVTIISVARGVEKVTPRRLVALAVAMAGIALTVGLRAAQAMQPTGVAMALGAAVLYAAFLPVVRRIQGTLPSTTATAFLAIGAAVIFLMGAATSDAFTLPARPIAWLWIVALGVLATAVPFTLFLSGLRALGPMRTAIVSTVEPFFVSVLAALVLHQPLTGGILLGGSCIAIAVILLQLDAVPAGRAERPAAA